MNLDWVALGSLSAVVAAVCAFFAILQSNRHLKIEQTPFVVVDHIIKNPSIVEISIKNVGRGPALHITCGKSDDSLKRNEAFFMNTEPHSVNLASGKEKSDWRVERRVFDSLTTDNDQHKHLFVFCESQFGTLYRTDVKVKDIEEEKGVKCYVVMENKIEEIKIEAECG